MDMTFGLRVSSMSSVASANPSCEKDDVRHLATALACAVTTASNDARDRVAKKGQESLFSVIRKLVPEVIPEQNCSTQA